MPNLTPQEWDHRAAAARSPGYPCGNATCVDVKRHDGGVDLTSTIDGNGGKVTYTHAEWDAFGRQVKDGDWDHTFGA